MFKPITRSAVARSIIIGVIFCHSQMARAGWSGAMNGTGFGWASVNVTSSTLHSNSVQTANMTGPSAAMTNTPGFTAGGPLPAGASKATIARIKGSAGYIWKATTTGANGDKTDNPSIDKLINLPGSDCATIEMDSSVTMAPDGKSGVVVINSTATPGTALLLRGFEYDDPTPPQSIQDLETNPASTLKWHFLLIGPFDLESNNCNALVIPFTVDTGDTNLYFVSDGEAKSLALELQCPSNLVVNCGDPVVYQPASYSACGDVTVSYSPTADFPFPVGSTPVTVTITDQAGDSTNCTFTVTVVDSVPPVKPYLKDLVFSACSGVPATPTIPTTTDTCAGVVSGTTPTQFPITALGLTVVTWTFTDPSGNFTTATQNVTLVDNVPPVKPYLKDLVFSACTGVPATPPTPTTTDNCAGIVSGTTATQFPITALGLTVVTWTFSDGNGNFTTATQNVTLVDNVAPVKPYLQSLTYNDCSGGGFTPPTPSTTDNCAGKVYGTTTTKFPITTLGKTVVTWTFTDPSGNFTSTTQNVTLTGLTFKGFESPINGTGGSCSSPQCINTCGNKIPIKFDLFCGSTCITSGTPPVVEIIPYSKNCVAGSPRVTANTFYQRDWTYNWDTYGYAKGVYEILVTLPDGTTQYVFVRLQ